MGFTQDLFTSRRNYSDGSSRIGQNGRLWYDHDTGSFRVGDGLTPGGTFVGVSNLGVTGVGISLNRSTGNVIFSSSATHLNIPNTIVARDANNASYIGTINATDIRISGNLTVLGATTYVTETTLALEDRRLILSNIAIPTDAAADSGGIILKGNVDHTFLWDRSSNTWTSSESISVSYGNFYQISGTAVLTDNNLYPTQATVNIAPSATTIIIGSDYGTTNLRNDLVINGNLSVTGTYPSTSNFQSVDFANNISNPSHFEGRVFYDTTVKALSYYTDDPELTLNIGQETVMRVINLSGETILSGNAVYIVGASGDKPRIAKARADNIIACQVVGLATTEMLHGDIGYVTLNGTVKGVNTAGIAAGTALYLSTTTPGAYSTTHPDHPFYDVHLGYVTRSNANNGAIEVQIRNVAFDRLMVAGNSNFEANVTVDRNLFVTGNASITGTVQVNAETTLASATVSDLTSGRIVIAGAAGSLNDSGSLTFNTGTNTLSTVNASYSGTLAVTGSSTLGTLTAGTTSLNNANVSTTLAVSGATTLSSTLSAGATTLNSLTVNNNTSIGGTFAVTGTSNLIGNITAGNISGRTLTLSDTASITGHLFVGGNLTVASGIFTVNGITGATYANGDVIATGKFVVSGGNLDVTTSTFNLAPTASDLRIGQNYGTTRIRNNLDVDGDLNIDGGYLTATTTAFNLLNTTQIVNAFTNATTLNLGSANGVGTTTVNNDLFLVGNLTVNGSQVTYNSAVAIVQDPVLLLGGVPPAAADDNKDRGIQFSWHTGSSPKIGFFGWDDSSQSFTVIPEATNIGEIFSGTPGDVIFGSVTGTTGNFSSTVSIASSLTVNGTGLNTSSSTFNLLNSGATAINFGSSATALSIGAATGITSIKNNLDIDLDLNIDGGDITTSASTFNILNTTASTINFAGAATSLIIGAISGTTNIRNNVDIDYDLNIDGNDLTTSSGSFNLLMTNAVIVNAFGTASIINLGSASGITNVKNSLDVDGTVNIDGGILSTNSSSFNLLNLNATNVNAFAAATNLQIGNSAGTTIIRNNTNINNSLDVDGPVNFSQTLTVDGRVDVDGFFDVDNSADIGLDLNVGRNLSVVGNLTIGSPGLVSTSLTFNLINAYTSTVNAFGAATSVNIGSSAGQTNINNDLQVRGTSIFTDKTTFNLVNTTASTINFAGATTALTIGAATGSTTIRHNLSVNGTLSVSGTSISVSGSSFDIANTNASTVNFAGQATSLTMGSTAGTTNIRNSLQVDGSLTVAGDLTVNGTLTTVNSTTLTVDDKNIELGSVTTPTDVTADGGGITLRGTTQKTINWSNANQTWTSSEHFNIADTKEYRINNTLIANSTVLGSSVIYSSLTTLGTINTGVWQGSIIAPAYGGTGVNNGNKTITLGGNFSTAGNFNLSLVLTAGTSLTLPTTGTVATLAGTETLTNKTVNLANNTLTGTLAEFNSALSGADFASLAGTETLTNKTVNLTNNTLSGTLAQFNTALSDADFASLAGTETLTNKTINVSNNTVSGIAATSFVLSNASGNLDGSAAQKAIPAGSVVGTSDSQTLTNKTINVSNNTVSGLAATSFVLSNASGNLDGSAAQKVIPVGTVVGTSDSQTLTNKTISVDNNTVSGLAATSFVLSNASGNLDGSAAQKVIPVGTVVGTSDTQTLTNKTINLANNSLSGTKAEFNSAVSDGDIGFTSGKLDQFATTSSAELAGVISDETGTGSLVFASGPTLTNVSITDVVKMTPLATAPTSPVAGMIAIADNQNWDPAARTGNRPYPVFYDGNDWLPMIAI